MTIAVTLGDPHSCNIELVYLSLCENPLFQNHVVVLIGSRWHWDHQTSVLRMKGLPPLQPFTHQKNPGLYFFDIGSPELAREASALSSEEKGTLAARALLTYQAWAQSAQETNGQLIHLLTAPIDKSHMPPHEFPFPGHTEFLAETFSCPTLMILSGPQLRVALVTNHEPISQVSKLVTQERVLGKADLLVRALQNLFGYECPRIAITGLNPHCGDGGLFGHEEKEVIQPAVAALQEKYGDKVGFTGPLPADTVFYRAYHGAYDAVLAMYHDQALGPLKTVHFDTAINVTAGLPICRVSPDHGPARELYLQGKASVKSFNAALRFLVEYMTRSQGGM